MKSVTLPLKEIVENHLQRMNPGSFDDLPCIGLEQLQSDSFNVLDLNDESTASSQKLAIEKGDVLFSRRRVYQRKVGIAPTKGVISTDCMVLRPKANIMAGSLLPFFIRSDAVMNEAIRHSAGSLSPRVNWSWMKDIKFTIPVFEEQKQYADLLWKTEHLIELYKARMDVYSELVKSRFIELFGKCEKIPLIEVANITMGQSPESSTYNEEGIGVPFYQGKTEFTDLYITKKTYCSEPKKMAKSMDLLMSVRAPVGAVNITKEDCCIGRGLAAISPKNDVTDLYFLFVALHMIENEIADMGTGSTFKAINKADMERITVPNANYPDQLKFSNFFQQVDKSKSALQTVVDDLKMLQRSISDQIFEVGGEADE